MIKKILVLITIITLAFVIIPTTKATILILNNRDSYDFSTKTSGELSGGDFY